jgi:hypothetical protein
VPISLLPKSGIALHPALERTRALHLKLILNINIFVIIRRGSK